MPFPFAAALPFLAKAAPYALSAASTGAGFFGSKKRNKGFPSFPQLPAYSGTRPPSVSQQYFRPIESEISDILMKRARGEDVGFDPRRLTELKGIYDINAQQRAEQDIPDIYNQLSGTGQSRNLAARDLLLGRYQREQGRERNKYFMGLDVEDLTRRNQERDINTARLQSQNEFNFGQQNRVADFDRSLYDTSLGVATAPYQAALQRYGQQDNPLAEGLLGGLSTLGAISGFRQQNAFTNALKQYGMGQQPQQPQPFGGYNYGGAQQVAPGWTYGRPIYR